ncbi:MAG: YhfC family intramembrane metalloprotease [Clostridiales bacterium]|nr:YhfC family intramembrane metalloprotease [Clostridiales bacterium]
MGEISGTTIMCLLLAAAGCIALPLSTLLIYRKKTNAQWFPFLAGMVSYLFFVIMLEQMLHMICLGINSPIAEMMEQYPLFYAAYLCVTAALFEEGGRYFMFRMLLKKKRGRETAVTFGIGFTIIETLSVIVTILGMVFVAVTIKNGGVEAYLSGVAPEDLAQTKEAVQNFIGTNPVSFLAPFIERIPSLLTSVGLSVFVFAAVWAKRPSLFGAAVGFHILQTSFWGLYQAGILNQTMIVEIGAILISIMISYLAWKIYKKLPQSEIVPKEKKKIEKPARKFEKMY